MRTVDDVLSEKGRELYVVAPDATVHEAIRIMSERNIGAVVVCSRGELIGILSERDCVRRVMLQGRSARETRIDQAMTSPVRSVGLSDTIDDCMQLMTDKRIRHLPVVDGKRVVGMLSVGDAVKAQLSEQEGLIEGLESYIHGPSASVRPPAS